MKKVLLTSSSKAFLKRNENLLTGKGFQLVTATSGAEAIGLHQNNRFDLILADLELDDMDGCTLCTEVHKAAAAPAVPVVLICLEKTESVETVRQSKAAAMLLRPIDPTQLLVTIGSFIDMPLARSKRIAFSVNVTGRKEGTEFCCVSHDISITGLLIGTDFRLVAGDHISCNFMLFDTTEIEADGEVTRRIKSPKGTILYGVRFIDLPLSKRSAIQKLVTTNHHLGVMQQPPRSIEINQGPKQA